MPQAALEEAAAPAATQRRILGRTRGSGSLPVIRLMSPSDLGRHLKPFVFLDLFGGDMRRLSEGMGLHPHSGIATVTVFTDGDAAFDDPQAGQGVLSYGGVEWMRAGGGVWHGKELSAGRSATMQGFQLWIALPPELENAEVDSQYIEAAAMPKSGPAHVILGSFAGVSSPVRSPEGINYLLVTLGPGERWSYDPPAGHSVGWLAVARGGLTSGGGVAQGEMAVLEPVDAAVELEAGPDGAVFVLGSARPHPHDLHLGYYSVHTSGDALARGERRIEELGARLRAAGDRRTPSGSTPVFR